MTTEDAPRREQAPKADPAELAASFFSMLQTTLAASVTAIETIGADLDGTNLDGIAPQPSGLDSPTVAELTPITSRAMLVAAGSSARYWRDLAALCGRHRGSLIRLAAAPPEPDTQQARIAADDLRAMMREAGDIATLEAQRLRQELSALGDAIAERMSASDAEPVRRWRAKS